MAKKGKAKAKGGRTKSATPSALQESKAALEELADVLGIDLEYSEEKIPQEIVDLVEERAAAKKEKNFARADEIRDILKEKGYSVKDTPNGPQIEKI